MAAQLNRLIDFRDSYESLSKFIKGKEKEMKYLFIWVLIITWSIGVYWYLQDDTTGSASYNIWKVDKINPDYKYLPEEDCVVNIKGL